MGHDVGTCQTRVAIMSESQYVKTTIMSDVTDVHPALDFPGEILPGPVKLNNIYS
jgi:hypothetical protein